MIRRTFLETITAGLAVAFGWPAKEPVKATAPTPQPLSDFVPQQWGVCRWLNSAILKLHNPIGVFTVEANGVMVTTCEGMELARAHVRELVFTNPEDLATFVRAAGSADWDNGNLTEVFADKDSKVAALRAVGVVMQSFQQPPSGGWLDPQLCLTEVSFLISEVEFLDHLQQEQAHVVPTQPA